MRSLSHWIIALFAVAFLLPNTQQFLARHDPSLVSGHIAGADKVTDIPSVPRARPSWSPTRSWAVLIGVMLGGGILTLSRVTEFLYFQF